LDEKIGTSGNDTFAAGFTTAATFNSGDTVDGGAGTDTLSITVGAGSTYALANVSNVEAVKGNFTAAGTLSLLGSSGVTSGARCTIRAVSFPQKEVFQFSGQ
jgi:hypothetical protein